MRSIKEMRKWKPVAFNSDILTKFAAAHGTKFAIPCQRKCRLICNAFPTDSSDYNKAIFSASIKDVKTARLV